MTIPGDRSSQGLCAGCGLCCDGVLFAGILLEPDELEWASRNHLASRETEHGPALCQPCACHKDSRCRHYASRPARCRSFECDMLRAYRRGELELSECEARIARVRLFTAAYESGARDSDAHPQDGLKHRAGSRFYLADMGLRELIHSSGEGSR